MLPAIMGVRALFPPSAAAADEFTSRATILRDEGEPPMTVGITSLTLLQASIRRSMNPILKRGFVGKPV